MATLDHTTKEHTTMATTTQPITAEMVLGWGPCEEYDRTRLEELLGEGKTALEVAWMEEVAVCDRLWCLLRPEVLGDDGCQRVVERLVERALRLPDVVEYAAQSPKYATWRDRWLSREDRAAREAAWAAAREAAREAAWAAAWAAARAAAWAAAREAARAAARAAAWAAAFAAGREAAGAWERATQLADIVTELER